MPETLHCRFIFCSKHYCPIALVHSSRLVFLVSFVGRPRECINVYRPIFFLSGIVRDDQPRPRLFLAGVAAGCWIDLCGNLIGLIGHSRLSEQPTFTLSSLRNKESVSLHAIFFTTFGHSVSSIHSSTCLLRPFHSTWRNCVSRLA